MSSVYSNSLTRQRKCQALSFSSLLSCSILISRNSADQFLVATNFQNSCGILLNRPRSDLNIDDVVEVRTCVSAGQAQIPGPQRAVYTAKAVSAANSVATLITLPTPLYKHTPFTTCITTMAAVVYLSYWSFCAIDGSDTFTKEQIRLTIGTLRRLGERWPLAYKVLGQVRGVARELYAARRAINSANWDAVTGTDLLRVIEKAEKGTAMQGVMDPALATLWGNGDGPSRA